MRHFIAAMLIGGSLAASHAQVLEPVLTTTAGSEGFDSDWAELILLPNSFLVTPDAEWIRITSGTVYMFNGNDTDDSDGDGVFRFTAKASPVASPFLMAQGSLSASPLDPSGTNSIEAALQAAGWTAINAGGEVIRGFDIDANGNIITAWDRANRSAFLRIDTTSTVTNPSVTPLFGSETAGNLADGSTDLIVDRNTNIVYVLQRAAFGAPQDRVVTFSANGPFPLTTTSVFLSAANLQAAGFVAGDPLFAINQDATHIYIAGSRAQDPATTNPVVVKFPKTGGTPTVIATQNQFSDFLGSEVGNLATGNLTVDATSGNVFVQFATMNIWRIGGGNQPPNRLLTKNQVEASGSYNSLIAGGALDAANDWGIAADGVDGFLYVSLESANSNTDSIIRIAQNPPPAAASDWMLFE